MSSACRTQLLACYIAVNAEHLTFYTGIICFFVMFLTRVCVCAREFVVPITHTTLAGKRLQELRLTWKTNLCSTNLLQSCVQQLLSPAPPGQGGKICWESKGRGDWCDFCSFLIKICYFRSKYDFVFFVLSEEPPLQQTLNKGVFSVCWHALLRAHTKFAENHKYRSKSELQVEDLQKTEAKVLVLVSSIPHIP